MNTAIAFHDALAQRLDDVDPEYIGARVQHSALSFEGDLVTLKDTTGLTIAGTLDQVLDNYGALIRRSLADQARQAPDADGETSPHAAPPSLADDVKRMQAEVDAKYAPDTAQQSARSRLGL